MKLDAPFHSKRRKLLNPMASLRGYRSMHSRRTTWPGLTSVKKFTDRRYLSSVAFVLFFTSNEIPRSSAFRDRKTMRRQLLSSTDS